MPTLKKILVSLPEELLEKVDSSAGRVRLNRSEFIRQALSQFLIEKHRMEIRERMKRGYEEMAGINSEWAELGLRHESDDLLAYEAMLSESELHD